MWDDWSHEASSSKALDEPEGDTGGEVEAGVSRTCCHDCWVFVGVSAEVSGSFMTDDRDWELRLSCKASMLVGVNNLDGETKDSVLARFLLVNLAVGADAGALNVVVAPHSQEEGNGSCGTKGSPILLLGSTDLDSSSVASWEGLMRQSTSGWFIN